MTYPDGKQVWLVYLRCYEPHGELDNRIQLRQHRQSAFVGDWRRKQHCVPLQLQQNEYITGEKSTENGKTTESAYTYDLLGRLTGFTKSTGYSEQHTYDKVGNMLEKVITDEVGRSANTGNNIAPSTSLTVPLKMQYNKANQLISMANGQDQIAYSYDKNGSMAKKVLTSKTYGRLTALQRA